MLWFCLYPFLSLSTNISDPPDHQLSIFLIYSTSLHAHSLPLGLGSTEQLCRSMIAGRDCGKLEWLSQWDCLVEHLAVSSWDSSVHLRSEHLPSSQPVYLGSVCSRLVAGFASNTCWLYRGDGGVNHICLDAFFFFRCHAYVWILKVGSNVPSLPCFPANSECVLLLHAPTFPLSLILLYLLH